METVYIETTFFGYLAARPSRDLLVAAHQQITHEWWLTRRGLFYCYVSQVVIDEVSGGNAEEAQKRLSVIGSLPVLAVTNEAETLARAILASGVMPPKAGRDA